MEGRRVLLGEVVGVFGLEGWLKIHSYTEPRDNILKYRPWTLESPAATVQVEKPKGRIHGKSLLAQLPAVHDPQAALGWVGAKIWVARERLPKPRKGTYYWFDLEGMRVENLQGVDLGVVSHLFATAAHDVLVVRKERERLIPFVTGVYVQSVDTEQRCIRVDWDPEF